MSKGFDETLDKKAWTMAITAWLAGVALLYAIHICIGEVDSRSLRWWLDAGLYAVGFFYFLALGALHDLCLKWLYQRSNSAEPHR